MGLFWDLLQQTQIHSTQAQAASVEERVRQLEQELRRTRELLYEVIRRLERAVGRDLDDDGQVG